MEKLIVPIEVSEIRSSQTEKGKYLIKGRAKITPGKKYSYMFKTDEKGNPLVSLKEVFTEEAWDKIKKKILSKDIFVDSSHKTVAELTIKRKLNELSRETGKDLKEFEQDFDKWLKVSELPMIKMEDVILDDDYMDFTMSMNPYFKEVDAEHSAYFDSVWGSLKEGYINSISLNFNPTSIDNLFDEQTGEYIPKIKDIDVYGISLVHNAGHDDMQDVLDVAIRMAQNVKEESKMQDEKQQMVKDVKEQVKSEMSIDAIKAENEKLKAELAEQDKLLKEKEKSEEKAKIDAMVAENERLKAEKKRHEEMLSSGSRGFVPPPPSQYDERKRVLELLEPIEKEKRWGHAIQLQADLKGLDSLPDETRSLAMNSGCDIRINNKGQLIGG